MFSSSSSCCGLRALARLGSPSRGSSSTACVLVRFMVWELERASCKGGSAVHGALLSIFCLELPFSRSSRVFEKQKREKGSPKSCDRQGREEDRKKRGGEFRGAWNEGIKGLVRATRCCCGFASRSTQKRSVLLDARHDRCRRGWCEPEGSRRSASTHAAKLSNPRQ